MPPHDPILIVPAIEADIALFHAPLADRDGNVWVGVRRELMMMAHAARRTIVTADHRQDRSLLADLLQAPGTLPGLYVEELAIIEGGGRPLGSEGQYLPDPSFAAAYKKAFRAGDIQRFVRNWALVEQKVEDGHLADA